MDKEEYGEYVLSYVKFLENTIDKINNGVTFTKSGKRVLNDLPSYKDNRVAHVRPHVQRRHIN